VSFNKLSKHAAILLTCLLFFGGTVIPKFLSEDTFQNSPAFLEKHIRYLIRHIDGELGIAVKHLETGTGFDINGGVSFPMASVIKLPIFVETMHQIKSNKLSLESWIDIQSEDQFYSGSLLSELEAPGIRLTLRNVINMMMKYSDNTATDLILKRVGIKDVRTRMEKIGLSDISVDRTIEHLVMDYYGLDYEKYKEFSKDEFEKVYTEKKQEDPLHFKEAAAKFSDINVDQSTPLAMNRLLEMIFKKEILDPDTCKFILDVMLDCRTGLGRIKGLLPENTPVAHKTGTVGGTVNDSGIIYLPEGSGHVALTVFSKNTSSDTRDMERVIADIARFTYDYFTFVHRIEE